MTTKLPVHEWCIILLFCLILLVLAGFALARPKPVATSVEFSSSSPITVMQVKVEGQVAKPGLYRLPLNATLRQLLEQAEPLSSADLSQLNWKRKLRNGQTLHIPERYSITIQIAGAVQQPGPLEILSGTRYCELANHLQVLPNADLKALCKKKSFIKDGDFIEVPVKKKGKKQRY